MLFSNTSMFGPIFLFATRSSLTCFYEQTFRWGLLCIVEAVRAKGAGFRSLAEDIDTTTPAGRRVFHVFASIAQFERDRISERTKEGLVAALKRGRVRDRPPALSADHRSEVTRMRDHEGRGIAELARLFEVSPNTIRRI